MIKNSMHFRRGQKFPDIVFLGACPGQCEWNANPQRPFAGKSGNNLKTLLSLLCQIQNRPYYGFLPNDFSTSDPDDYTLMNSHSTALWKARHKRTLPKPAEVEDTNNIQRLADELASVQARVLIGLGRPVDDAHLVLKDRQSGPMLAIRLLQPQHSNISFSITGHPSPQAINRYGKGDAKRWLLGKLRRFP